MSAPMPEDLAAELALLAALGLPLDEGPEPSPEAVAEWAEAASQLAHAAPLAAPAPELKARLFARLAATGEAQPFGAAAQPPGLPLPAATPPAASAPAPEAPPAPPKLESLTGGRVAPAQGQGPEGKVLAFPRRQPVGWQVACAALVVGLGLSLAWGGSLKRQLDLAQKAEATAGQRAQAVAAKLAELEAKLADSQARLAQASMPASLMQASELRVASLKPMGPSQELRARLFWSPEAASWMLVVAGMPKPQPGHSYQAWAVGAKGKVNLGAFMPDGKGMAVVPVAWPEAPGPGQVAAVSVEADMAPMPEPKGPIVLMGKLDGAAI